MIGFVIYAALVWWAGYRWRRRWLGFAWVALGFLGLVGMAVLHWRLSEWTHGRIYLPVLQVLLYPYTLLVAAGGCFMAAMPKMLPFRCATCGYDLEGLEGDLAVCPECGRTHAMVYRAGDDCHACGAPIDVRRVPAGGVVTCRPCGLVHFVPRRATVGYSAAYSPVHHADDQHQHGQTGDDQPPQQGQPGRGDVADHGEGAGRRGLSDEVILPA